MNAVAQGALDTLESKLQELIESISSYNPSPAAALALVHADDELTVTLEMRRFLLLLNPSNTSRLCSH